MPESKKRHVKHFAIRKSVDSATGADATEYFEIFETEGTV